jgi:hypothetical protein
MKKDEPKKAISAKAKNGAFAKMLGNMFTADARETDATAKKTTKTAVNLLSMLSPVFLTFLMKFFFLCADTLFWAGEFDVDGLGKAEGACLLVAFVFLLHR